MLLLLHNSKKQYFLGFIEYGQHNSHAITYYGLFKVRNTSEGLFNDESLYKCTFS